MAGTDGGASSEPGLVETRKTPLKVVVSLTVLTLILPTLGGWALLALTIAGIDSHFVERSPAATATALVVALALILVPPALFMKNPKLYMDYQTVVRNQIKEATGSHPAPAAAPEILAGAQTPPPSSTLCDRAVRS